MVDGQADAALAVIACVCRKMPRRLAASTVLLLPGCTASAEMRSS